VNWHLTVFFAVFPQHLVPRITVVLPINTHWTMGGGNKWEKVFEIKLPQQQILLQLATRLSFRLVWLSSPTPTGGGDTTRSFLAGSTAFDVHRAGRIYITASICFKTWINQDIYVWKYLLYPAAHWSKSDSQRVLLWFKFLRLKDAVQMLAYSRFQFRFSHK